MTAIDILIQIKPETQSEVSKKTYADKSDAFENVFDKINKNYNKKENKFNFDDKKIDYQNKTDRNIQKENDKSNAAALKNNSPKDTESSNTTENASKAPKEKNTSQCRQNTLDNDKIQPKESLNENKESSAENKVSNNTEQEPQKQPIGQIQQAATALSAEINAADILLKNLQTINAPNQNQNQEQNQSQSQSQSQNQSQSQEQDQSQNQVQDRNQNQTQTQNQADNVKIQTQPQIRQILPEINIENILRQNTHTQTEIQLPQNVQTDIRQADVDLKAKIPVIQANIDIKTKGDETPEQKQAIKDILQKTILTQEMLDATNARVTSLERNTFSGDLPNERNAQENTTKSLTDTNRQSTQNLNTADVKISFNQAIENIQEPKEISKNDILAQVHTKLTEAKNEGSTRITIILKPENLGKISLELINGKNGLLAKMTAENMQVKELLEKNLDGLKTSLGAQGVQINDVNVKVENIEKQSNEMLNFEHRQQNMQNEQEQKDSPKAGGKEQKTQNDSLEFSDDSAVSEDSAEKLSIPENYTGRIDYKV